MKDLFAYVIVYIVKSLFENSICVVDIIKKFEGWFW